MVLSDQLVLKDQPVLGPRKALENLVDLLHLEDQRLLYCQQDLVNLCYRRDL